MTTEQKAPAEIDDVEELRREIRATILDDSGDLPCDENGDNVHQRRRKKLESRSNELYTPEERAKTKAARDKADEEYLSWCTRQGEATKKMRQSDLFPFNGGLEQPVFWQNGKVVESGAARLDYLDSRHELKILLNTARAYQKTGGYEVPKAFLLEAAQFFYSGGQLCEVRLSGYDMMPGSDESGEPTFARWQTQTAPDVRADEKNITLTNDADKRPQIAVLNETTQEILTLERDYYTRQRTKSIKPPKNVLRLLIAWGLNEQPSREFEQTIPIALGSNFPGDRDLHRGLMLKNKVGTWGTNENEGTIFYDGAECITKYRPPEIFPEWWQDTREATLKQLDRRFREMRSELTADVIDILFHHWYKHRDPQKQEKAAITLSQLCEYRGIQTQKKNLAALWEAMRDARSFRLMGDGIDAALFEMDAARAPQSNLWGLEDPPRADIVYFFSPGFFLAQAIKENPIYLAPYVRKVWELDPYRDANAKRLARYLRGEWRMNTQKYLRPKDKAPTRYRNWQSILDAAGVDIEEYLNSPNPSRLRKDVETALETLYDIEAIAECGATIYHSDDRIASENLPRNGAMKVWLQLRVCIDPPADVTDALQEPNAKRVARTIEAKALTTSTNKVCSGNKKPKKAVE